MRTTKNVVQLSSRGIQYVHEQKDARLHSIPIAPKTGSTPANSTDIRRLIALNAGRNQVLYLPKGVPLSHFTTQNLLDNMGKFVQQKPTCGESEHGYTQRSRI